MFFTIVIPACNCEDTIERLLDSIKNQDTNDFKVIIVDDCYGDHDISSYVEPYKKYFDIDFYKREEEPYTIHCPGNTRHSGLKRALEEDTDYIIFADADDRFKENTFRTLKWKIKEYNYPNVISSVFDAFDTKDNFLYKETNSLGWLHGKIYKKTFLKNNNIQFKVDMLTHEDTYFNCLMSYYQILMRQDLCIFQNYIFYEWVKRDDSFTHKNFDNTDEIYIQKYYVEYCTSCIDVYLDAFKKNPIQEHDLRQSLIIRTAQNIAMAYCYFQGFITRGKREYLKDNYIAFKDRVWKFFKVYDLGKEDLIKIIYSDPKFYMTNKEASFRGVGQYVEQQSFRDFINDIKFYE